MYRLKIFFRNHPKIVALIIGVIFVLGNLIIANNTRKDNKRYVFWSDAGYYYSYLPALFISHNLLENNFESTNGKATLISKYTSGVAILQTPFFLIALAVSKINDPYTNGLSETFEFLITMGTLFYCFLGLLMLYKVLTRYVKPRNSIITLIAIYFATNLEYYCVGESGMAHAYSFFTMSWFIYSLFKHLDKPTYKNSISMGLSFGLSVLIRPTNAIIILLPLFIKLYKASEIKNRLKYIFQQKIFYTLIFVVFSFIAILPQLLYWKSITGSYIFYSYQGESFTNWTNPKMVEILFGSVSGLFVYSAVLLFIIPGLIILWNKRKKVEAIGIILIFVLITYTNASWWIPTFDCSFGHRAFIEFYPLLTIPIALFVEWAFQKRRAILFSVLFGLLIFINVRMTALYKVNPCWISEKGSNKSWAWNNIVNVLRSVFYIDDKPSYNFHHAGTKEKPNN